jgi:hypothetical protein
MDVHMTDVALFQEIGQYPGPQEVPQVEEALPGMAVPPAPDLG